MTALNPAHSVQGALNLYGDRRLSLAEGRGVDIGSQRLDELDWMAIRFTEALMGNPALPHPPLALDVGCGAGGLLSQLAARGTRCLGIDLLDHRAAFERQVALALAAAQSANRIWHGMAFHQLDVADLPETFVTAHRGRVAVILSQRTLHYLPYPRGVSALKTLATLMSETSRLFLSVSGLGSELSAGYRASHEPLASRFAPLGPEMADRHDIRLPVCLYTEDDIRCLLEAAGFRVLKVFSSAFGNVKAVAEPG